MHDFLLPENEKKTKENVFRFRLCVLFFVNFVV